jgi:hypothetical protein
LALGITDVINASHVGVGDLERHPHLVQEALEPTLVPLHLARQKLQRHRLTELQVIGSVDLAHPAPAQQADDSIPLGQHRARQEPTLINGGRRDG